MSTSSSSTGSVAGTSKIYSYSSSGLSGLVSGMDTETMVKKMLEGTQKKIDKQKQQKQVLTWKQTMYRSAITSINTLRNKYFDSSYDSTLSSNLSSSKFFNTKNATVSSGDSVSVATADSTADIGDMTFKVSQLATATKITGTALNSSNSITGSAIDFTALNTQLATTDGVSFDVSLDGVTKTIKLVSSDFSNSTATADNLQSTLNTKLNKEFGGYVTASYSDSKLTLTANVGTEAGHELTVTGVNAKYVGITAGSTSLLSSTATLGSLKNISGGSYQFSINGTDFTFSSTDTVGDMISRINSSDAGVKLTYSSSTNAFSLQSSTTGAQYGITVKQTNGNLLSAVLGSSNVSAGASLAGQVLNTGSVSGTALSSSYTTTGAKLAMTVNGQSYTFSMTTKTSGSYSASDVGTSLNTWLKSNFGTQSDGTTQNISYDVSTGKFTTAAGYSLSFAKTGVASTDSTAATDLGVAMGLSAGGATNAVSADTSISDIPGLSGIKDLLLKSDGTAATTLSEVASVKDTASNLAASFDSATGALRLTGTAGTTETISSSALQTYFGASSYTFGAADTTANVTAGTDLKITINGTETSRNSNTFTVDGLTVTAKKVDTDSTSSTITTTRDTESIVTAVKNFVSDYNSLVTNLYGKITEDYTYKDYAPLTDAQKEDMSESAITAWEKKAQTGLLRSDSTISSFLQQMTESFYTTVDKAGIAAYSVGIESTQNDLTGKLTFDESLFRTALASDPDAVSSLFTDSTSGLSTMLAKAMDGAAKLSSASPGSLVQLAGADGWTANAKNNDIYIELQTINDKLDDLQDKYDDEKERYWTKFNSMETAITKYQSQSAQITSSFSS